VRNIWIKKHLSDPVRDERDDFADDTVHEGSIFI